MRGNLTQTYPCLWNNNVQFLNHCVCRNKSFNFGEGTVMNLGQNRMNKRNN